MSEILELSDKAFKITIINMLTSSSLKNGYCIRIDGECKQIDENTKKQSQRNNRNQTFVTEMKNVFDGPIGRLSTAMKRINELECMSIEISRPKMQINF